MTDLEKQISDQVSNFIEDRLGATYKIEVSLSKYKVSDTGYSLGQSLYIEEYDIELGNEMRFASTDNPEKITKAVSEELIDLFLDYLENELGDER